MSSADALYQEGIVRHARAGRGAGHLDDVDATVRVDNPLCGDRVDLDLKLRAGRIDAVAHRVKGCLICQATASVISDAAPGEDRAAIAAARRAVEAMLREGAAPPPGRWKDMSAFEPVRAARSRHDCVLLPFEALGRALAEAETGA